MSSGKDNLLRKRENLVYPHSKEEEVVGGAQYVQGKMSLKTIKFESQHYYASPKRDKSE